MASISTRHHYVRTAVAAILGTMAMVLIAASILVVWVNRTLTDNATYVQTVGPLLERPELQGFVAAKITDQALQETTADQLAVQVLTPEQRAGKTPEQLKAAVTQVIHERVVQVLRSPGVQAAWRDTNASAQAQLIRQLDAGTQPLRLDMTLLVNAVVGALQQENLVPVQGAINLPAGQAEVTLSRNGLTQVRNVYHVLKAGTVIVVLLALLLAGLSAWASVHHMRTVRRILVGTSLVALTVAGAVWLPQVIHIPQADPATQQLAVALAGTLLHRLQLGCLVLGVMCLAVAVGSKLYERWRRGKRTA